MKIDISRDSYQRFKHYTRVLMQQGRVQLDADWNEQIDILWHHLRALATDPAGPRWGAGASFRVAVGKGEANAFALTVGQGDYYVEGALCELRREPVDAASEHLGPFGPLPALVIGSIKDGTITPGQDPNVVLVLPEPPEPPLDLAKAGVLIYLEVSEELVTALDDADIREVALGGADTAARTRVVFRLRATKAPDKVTRDTALYYKVAYRAVEMLLGPKPAGPRGKLAARTGSGGPGGPASPCVIPADSRYRGLENQLYRVEIHRSGTSPKAGPKAAQGAAAKGEPGPTFVWSRDNGSIVAHWKATQGNTVEVDGVGREGVTGFAEGQWVELTHGTTDVEDAAQVGGKPTDPPVNLFRISKPVDGNVLTLQTTVTLSGQQQQLTLPPHPDDQLHPKVRRWDSPGEIAVEVPLTNDGWIALEDGIEVKFEEGKFYRRGDYWLIPARTNLGDGLGDILWPRKAGQPLFQYARHPFAHRAPLAFLPKGESPPATVDLRVSLPRPLQFVPALAPSLTGTQAPLNPPLNSRLLFRLVAVGMFEYKPVATDPNKWVLLTSTANLFDEGGAFLGTHGLDPTDNSKRLWEATDGSRLVTPEVPDTHAPGPVPSEPGELEWALYTTRTAGSAGLFQTVNAVQRLYTISDKVPTKDDNPGPDEKTRPVRYLALYYFYQTPPRE
jgi:hypothetical protein